MQVDADKTRGQQAMGLPYFLLFAGGYAMALASLAPVMLVLAVALYGAGLYLRKHAVPIKNGMPDIGPQVENVQRFMRSVLTRVEPSAQPKPSRSLKRLPIPARSCGRTVRLAAIGFASTACVRALRATTSSGSTRSWDAMGRHPPDMRWACATRRSNLRKCPRARMCTMRRCWRC